MAKTLTKAAPKPAAKAASKTAAKTANTVTLRHIGVALSESHDMPKKQANAVLEDMVALITKHLKKGDRIRIGGLGILQVRKRPARMGRNPATGEAIKIKASKKVAFRAAKDLKEQI
jgi:DNA-binding protein HU-beta